MKLIKCVKNKYFLDHEEFIIETCKKIYDSNEIKNNQCLLYTAMLFKYFDAEYIPVKVHITFIHNGISQTHPTIHMWLSYKGQKIDVTADKQDSFKDVSTVLGHKLGGYKTPYSSELLYKKDISKIDNFSNFKSLNKKMIQSAIKNKDSSIDDKYIKVFIENPQLLEDGNKEDFTNKFNSFEQTVRI